MVEHRAVVVGAGIAGLASAIALSRSGWQVTVLERAPELREVGAGIGMSGNSVAALRGLGLTADDVAGLGHATWAAGVLDLHGRPVLTLPDEPRMRAAVAIMGVHRARLHAALHQRARAAEVEIVTGAPVGTVDPGVADGAPAVVAGREAELVVAADGLHSAVRTALHPTRRPVYSGFSSWRAIAPGAHGEHAFRQYWGPRAEVGLLRVSDAETYWYGYVALPQGTSYDEELTAARERFAGWPAAVQDALAATPASRVMRHDVFHLPGGLPTYVTGRVVVVGDAAHAMLPTMGQGAATALEDGLSVGLLVGSPVAAGGRLAPALAAYDAARRPRCRGLARAALASGRYGAHLGGGLRQVLRNRLMRLTPPAAIIRGSARAMGWTPPTPGMPA